jgi:23S rRNA (adenine2503-C2)-methyltransferase
LTAETPDSLVRGCPAVTLAEARKIVSAVHKRGGVPARIDQVRRVAIEAIHADWGVPSLAIAAHERSALDPFQKLVFRAEDGALFEAVRIPLEKPGCFSVCVSSQVGCALACDFCATGRMGLRRNLEVWEIVEQVRAVRATLGEGERITGVVFQGMGEPMANLERVLAAIRVLTDPCAQSIDGRAITVCTAGLPSGIRRLAAEAPKVRLGLSIGSARPPARRSLMPIDRAHPFSEVLDAAVAHAQTTGYAPMWALTLLAGVNDGEEDAIALAAAAKDFAARAGVRPRISIIPYNASDGDRHRRASDEAERRFRDVMASHGVPTHKRYSGGGDVGAACGQLVARVSPR